MIALVRGVIAASRRSGSRLKVGSSMSTNTGRAPVNKMVLTDAMNVNELVITSSPGPIPCARRARCRPVVPDDVAIACLAPVTRTNPASSSATLGPWASMPDSSTSITAAFSSGPIQGRETGMKGGGVETASPGGTRASFANCANATDSAPTRRIRPAPRYRRSKSGVKSSTRGSNCSEVAMSIRRLFALPLVLLALAACDTGGTAQVSPSAAPPTKGWENTGRLAIYGASGSTHTISVVGFITVGVPSPTARVLASVTVASRTQGPAPACPPSLSGSLIRCGAPGVDLPYVSTSKTKIYVLDGDATVMVLAPDGSLTRVASIPGTATVSAAFAVSPDDSQIAVGVEDFGS